jgi:hypothetical protein
VPHDLAVLADAAQDEELDDRHRRGPDPGSGAVAPGRQAHPGDGVDDAEVAATLPGDHQHDVVAVVAQHLDHRLVFHARTTGGQA